MANIIRGSKSWENMMVQEFGNDLRKLYEKAPEAKAEIVRIARKIAELMDLYMESARPQEMAFAIIMVDKDNNITEIES